MAKPSKIGRNDPCHCGSGTKYKKCCLIKSFSSMSPPPPPTEEDFRRNGVAHVPILGTKCTTLKSFVWKDRRWRTVHSTLVHRPIVETFHQFLIVLLVTTLGQDWVNSQKALPLEKRHVILNWVENFKALSLNSPLRLNEGVYAASGPMNAALFLAFDLYLLQLVNKLPDSLVERLRDPLSFQGARYEAAIASIFARAGFQVEWFDNKGPNQSKHCEFIAAHKDTGTLIHVEAKSRVRRGVLHEPGTFNEQTDVKGDVRGLYQSALTQAPPDKPFLIFIDANLPADSLPPMEEPDHSVAVANVPWALQIDTMLRDDWNIDGKDKTADTAVIITNFAPHFGDSDIPSPQNSFFIVDSPKPLNPIEVPFVMNDVFTAMRQYGVIPHDV